MKYIVSSAVSIFLSSMILSIGSTANGQARRPQIPMIKITDQGQNILIEDGVSGKKLKGKKSQYPWSGFAWDGYIGKTVLLDWRGFQGMTAVQTKISVDQLASASPATQQAVNHLMSLDRRLRKTDINSQTEFAAIVFENRAQKAFLFPSPRSSDGSSKIPYIVETGADSAASVGQVESYRKAILQIKKARPQFKIARITFIHTHPASNEPLSLNDIAYFNRDLLDVVSEFKQYLVDEGTIVVKTVAAPIDGKLIFSYEYKESVQ